MTIKRIVAYLLDLLIITFITAFIYTLPIFQNTQEEYMNNYNNYLNEYTSYLENNSTDEKLITAEYNMMQSSSTLLITKIGVTIMYFCIIPFFAKGKTLGKKIMKLQVVPNKGNNLNPGLFFLRGLISSLVVIDIINILALILGNQDIWITITALTSLLSYITYITLLQFVIIRKDKRSLHDLISNTKVINLNSQQKSLNT